MTNAISPSVRNAWTAGIAAMALLLATGWGQRALEARIDATLGTLIEPQQPLRNLPLRLGAWRGWDVPIDERVQRVGHFDDDHVSRAYRHADGRRDVYIFVGYQGRPRARFGHRPDQCYPSHGWVQIGQRRADIEHAGHIVPATLYEFRPDNGLGGTLRVLATYIVNGQYVEDPGDAQQFVTRGVFRERPAYVTRIQLSVTATPDEQADVQAMQALAGLAAEEIRAMMPYWE